jgi:lipoprotein-anchoring transpeptidase ErfK/SrfK
VGISSCSDLQEETMTRLAMTISAVLVTLVVVLVAAVFAIDGSGDDRIAEGIHVGTVDVGGLDAGQARARVQRELAQAVRLPVRVRYGAQGFVLRPEIARASLDVKGSVEDARRRGRDGSDAFSRVFGGGAVHATVVPRIDYARDAVQAFVDRVSKRVNRPAKDADIDIRDGKLLRQHARNGVDFKRPLFVAALMRGMGAPRGARTVTVPVTVTARPDRTLDEIAKRYPTVIAVNRDAKELRLYKHLRLVHRYEIAVGRAGLETAAGRYKIQEKIVNPPWHVPNSSWAGDLAGRTIAAGDPQNPLEARWMGFHDGQGIHGTTDLASLGTAASHGCIRMSIPAVKQLYREVKVGSPLFLQ